MGALDLGVALVGQVLHLVDEVVLGGVGHELDADGQGVVRGEIVGIQFLAGRLGIVDGAAGDLIGVGLGGGGGDQRVGQVAGFQLDEVGVEDDFGAGVHGAQVVVLHRKAVHGHVAEDGGDDHVAGDHGVSGHFGIRALDDPLHEDLAGHEGILGHGADGFARGAEELLQALHHGFAVIAQDDEGDAVRVGEDGFQDQVGGHGLAAEVLGLIDVPAGEFLALDHGVGGEGQGVAGVIGVGFVRFPIDHELHGEDGLLVVGPDGHVAGDAVIVETATDNKNRTAADVRHVFDKAGGNLGTTGCVSYMFNKKGIIVIEKESTTMDEDELMMLALEAGAEDFEASEEIYEITTSASDFTAVREKLEEAGLEFLEAEVQMVPTTTVSLDEKAQEKMERLIERLEELDDVSNIYHNWDE